MADQTFLGELGKPAVERGWAVESRVRAIAGTLVLIGTALAAFVDVRWLWLVAFVGANLLAIRLDGLVLDVEPSLGWPESGAHRSERRPSYSAYRRSASSYRLMRSAPCGLIA